MQMLVVIDYQNDFVDGSLGFPGAEKLDSGIAALVRNAELVVATQDTHSSDYLNSREGKALPVVHCVAQTQGWELYGETGRALRERGAKVVTKPGFPLSPATLLDREIFPDEVEEIVLVGLVTNICVLANAVMLRSRYPEAVIKVKSGLCASFDPALHEQTLAVLAGTQYIIEP